MTRRNPSDLAQRPRSSLLAIGCLSAAALLLYSSIFSALAPFGSYSNFLFGDLTWHDFDPGTYYVVAAHQLAWGEPAIFIGHPGTPFLPLLWGVQRLLFAFHAGDASFTHWAALHLPEVHLASRLLVTALHLASLATLFAFARRLLRDELGALFACLGYATSLPFLFFLSRISVEPLMLLCLWGAFLALWRYEELATSGRRGRALGWAALASAAAVSGAMTKLLFLAPLLPLLLLATALGPRGSAGRIDLRTRAQALLVMAGVGAALLLFWSQWIDWPAFFEFWLSVPDWYDPHRPWLLAPSATAEGALPLCEWLFVAVAVAGWIAALRRGGDERARTLQVGAYAAFALAVFAYRVRVERSFLPVHYLLPASAVLTVYFGEVCARLVRRLASATTAPRALLVGVASLAVVHGLSIWVAFDSRLRDVESYRRNAALFERLARLAPSQRLGLVRDAFDKVVPMQWVETHAMYFPLEGPNAPRLRREFEAQFVPIEEPDTLGAEALFVPTLGAQAFVVEVPAR